MSHFQNYCALTFGFHLSWNSASGRGLQSPIVTPHCVQCARKGKLVEWEGVPNALLTELIFLWFKKLTVYKTVSLIKENT